MKSSKDLRTSQLDPTRDIQLTQLFLNDPLKLQEKPVAFRTTCVSINLLNALIIHNCRFKIRIYGCDN